MNNNIADLECLLSMAERELSAFMSAVEELYGLAQARIAAEDWVEAFESTTEPFDFTAREWRKITIVSASRLAARGLKRGYTPFEPMHFAKG